MNAFVNDNTTADLTTGCGQELQQELTKQSSSSGYVPEHNCRNSLAHSSDLQASSASSLLFTLASDRLAYRLCLRSLW